MNKLHAHNAALALTIALLTACSVVNPIPEPSEPPGPTLIPSGDDPLDGLIIDRAGLQLLESYPVQVRLVVEGSLPTPCHRLVWDVLKPDADRRIEVTLQAAPPGEGETCAQVLTPFEEAIPLGSFTEGAFAVWLNGERVEAFDLGTAIPSPEPARGVEGPVYVEDTDLLLMESYPVQVALLVSGNLPTPCHELRWEVSDADPSGRIVVEMVSIADAETLCVQVLEPFEERIPLGSYESGAFSVWLNGEQVADFDL